MHRRTGGGGGGCLLSEFFSGLPRHHGLDAMLKHPLEEEKNMGKPIYRHAYVYRLCYTGESFMQKEPVLKNWKLMRRQTNLSMHPLT